MNDVRERYLEGLLRDVGDSNTKLRAQLADTAALLDRLADKLVAPRRALITRHDAAAECRAEARKLRGET